MSRPVLLVCVDLSDAGEAILATVRRLAADEGARVHLLHAAAPEPDFVGYDPPGGPYDVATRSDELTEERDRLAEMIAALRADGIEAEAHLRQGPTVEVINHAASDVGADLIVVGSHGHGAMHHLLVGSTTEALIRHAIVPLVVVPANRT